MKRTESNTAGGVRLRLLAAGADSALRNDCNETAHEIARMCERFQLLELLAPRSPREADETYSFAGFGGGEGAPGYREVRYRRRFRRARESGGLRSRGLSLRMMRAPARPTGRP